MDRVEVRLLGRPTVLVDGLEVSPPKGAKPWGLLAYLAATERAHPRFELAELLFCEAEDPLGALRWSLAALRRLLDRPEALKGDAILLDLVDVVIDTRQLDAGELGEPTDGAAGHELLAGLSFGDSPLFELWLTAERSRLRARRASLVREAVLRSLARGEYDVAAQRATELVRLDPLDEGHHALLIRTHTTAGDLEAARHQYERCHDLLQAELGCGPGPAVIAAINLGRSSPATAASDRRVVDARMTVAWQSFLSGSVDHAIDLGRSVVALSDRDGDTLLRITARLFLASMLSIAVRGWDESATVTTEALHLAEQGRHPFEEAMARGVFAGNELMRGDYRAAVRHATAGAAACSEAGALAFNLIFLAASEADTGQCELAVEHALAAAGLAEETADPLRLAYTHAYAGHAFLLAGDLRSARRHTERAAEVATSMLVLQPWPLAMLAEIEARVGNLDIAASHAARALALATTTDMAYQRGLALRAMALVETARGNHAKATQHLTDALFQARRTTGEGYTFHWPVAWILDTLAEVCAHADPCASRRWATVLLEHATQSDMGAFVERAERVLAIDPDDPDMVLGASREGDSLR